LRPGPPSCTTSLPRTGEEDYCVCAAVLNGWQNRTSTCGAWHMQGPGAGGPQGSARGIAAHQAEGLPAAVCPGSNGSAHSKGQSLVEVSCQLDGAG
jgi:hypothetical protein